MKLHTFLIIILIIGLIHGVLFYIDLHPKTYIVIWEDYDGTILEIDYRVEEHTIPYYSGEEPFRPYGYTELYQFIGWSPAISPVTEDVTYIAQFVHYDTMTTFEINDANVFDYFHFNVTDASSTPATLYQVISLRPKDELTIAYEIDLVIHFRIDYTEDGVANHLDIRTTLGFNHQLPTDYFNPSNYGFDQNLTDSFITYYYESWTGYVTIFTNE